MKTINEKRIKVISVIEELSDDGLVLDSERSESVYDAFLKADGDSLSISYAEDSEGGRIFSDISISSEEVSVVRTGAIKSSFKFCDGLLEKTLYEIPPYSFDVDIYTKKIRNNLTREGGSLSILYEMCIGGAKKRVMMKINLLS